MKYTKWYFFLALLNVGLAASPLLAQSLYAAPDSALVSSSSPVDADSDQRADSVLTIRKRVDEVNLLFIATDKHGKFVRNLSQNDFTILDDHKPPQSIVDFSRQTDLPLHLALLVDVSGSVRSRFDFEQDAAISFLQQIVRADFDQALVAGFNSQTTITQDFTDNVALLANGVRRLHNGGGTALYDAIYKVCHDKLSRDADGRPVRRAIIVVSDGEDNQSQHSEAEAIAMAQRAQVILYAISTDDSGLILRGDWILSQLADATGGRAFFPYKTKDVKNSFAAIEDELRSQYIVSYHPADFEANGHYRPVEITAVKKDLQVRARKGYYAPVQ